VAVAVVCAFAVVKRVVKRAVDSYLLLTLFVEERARGQASSGSI
jgi:hypothetical protein